MELKRKAYEIESKAVAFNVLDPDQKALFEHAMQRSNFSGYIKRLIQRDLERQLRKND